MDIQQDFHIITTDNSFYRNLGLDILTTGSLVDWWDETQNRVIIENPEEDDAPRVLGGPVPLPGVSWMEFVPDEEYPTIGTYEEKTLKNVLDNPSYDNMLSECYKLVDPKIEILGDLASLIKLNEIVSTVNKEKGKIFTGIVPGEEISNYPPEWQDVLTSLNLELMKNGNELLQKIKKSKSGYIDFTAKPRFIIHPYGFIVEDSVKFKLLLLDDNNSEISKPGVAINDLRFSTITNIQSGGENQQETRAGSLDATWDQSTNKYKAGNKIVYAKLIDGIGRATDNVKAETLQNQLNEQALSQPSTENQVAPARGSGIPFFSQDPNSLQWTPSYVLPANKRCFANQEEAKEKVIYEVYNYSSTRSYKKDELVLLTDIGNGSNKWSIMPLNEPPVEEEVVEGAGAEKWGPFTYFWTNSDFFFRDAVGRRFTPRDAERAAHYEYYNSSSMRDVQNLNGSTNYGKEGGYSTSFSFDTSNQNSIFYISLKNGYFQTTSFDYLDGQILGTNDYCRISTTNPNRRPDGTQIPFDLNQYASRNAAICGIFHGCIFPDGYTGFEGFLGQRSYTVQPNIANSFMTGIIQTNGLPFDPDQGRNQCRNATLANLNEELNYDNVVWARAKDEEDLSIFSSTTLDSVPADVMLNASLGGVNGSPIVPITSYRFHEASSSSDDISILNDTNIFEPLVNNHWAARIPETEDGRSDAFDFTPNNPNHIMFRPLKLEAYIQIDGINSTYASEDLTRNGSHNSRWIFSAEAWRTQMDFEMPISQLAAGRNLALNDESFWSVHDANNPAIGPKWGGDVSNNLVYNYLHNYSYWSDENLVGSNGAMKWARNTNYVKNTSQDSTRWKGAKAFGVITASKTINATQSISLTTNNRYGMGAAAHGEFTINNGHKNQDRTWGNDFSDNSYRQHNITDLSVRIYHHHPVEQTIYDPRTFAVHHLNPHLALNGHYNNSGERPTTSGIVTHQGTEYYIEYQEPLTDVDYRVPTDYKHDENKITSAELNVGTLVWSDVSGSNNEGGGEDGVYITYPLPEEYWALKTDRVGKLLPYRWARKVIKFSSFCPTDRGVGYKIDDIIGNTEYGIRLRVSSFGDEGEVQELSIENRGSVLPRSGLCKSDGTPGTIRLSGIQTEVGQGFDAGVIGEIVEEIVTDPKPLLVLNNGQDITRISSDTLKPNHPTTGKNSTVEPLAIVDESKSTSIEITDKSPNGQYDLFFHFHNDISHTWLASNEDFHGGLNNQTECVEQYVDLRISTF